MLTICASFLHNINNPARSDHCVVELVEAEGFWIKKAQTELKEQKNYEQLSNSLRLMEEEGILRCKGRLKNSDLELSARYPIILPKDHRLTELLVRKSHSDVHLYVGCDQSNG